VLTIGDFDEADIAAFEERQKFARVHRRNIRVLQTLQYDDRASRIKRLAGKKVLAAVFNQAARNRIGFSIVGRFEIDAVVNQSPARFVRKFLPHQFFGHVPCGCDQDKTFDAAGVIRCLPHKFANEDKRNMAAHAGAYNDLRPA
jgi:hypothetical protein